MAPNTVFNSALDRVNSDSKTAMELGQPIKGYGRDFGGRREGRRNFVQHQEYEDDDGVAHTRIIFNIEGPKGDKAKVYADVAETMSSGQFYYLIIETLGAQKKVWSVVDNRPQIPLSVRQCEVAELLTKNGAVLYGSNRCAYTRKQLAEFGIDGVKKIQYVNCDDNYEECKRQLIQGLPSWKIKGRVEPGVKKLEDLYTAVKKVQR